MAILPGPEPHVDIALAPVEPNPGSLLNKSLIYKQGVAARASASNFLWLTGFADQAVVQAADAVAIGLEHDVLGLCYGLAQAIVPLAFWTGNLDQARAHTMLLIDLASDNHLGFWLHWGRSYECALQRLSSKPRGGADFIETSAASLGGLHVQILATILGDALGSVQGDTPPQAHWCAAELLRVAALSRLKDGEALVAQRLLEEALTIASRQGALAWELRAATTLAELLPFGRARSESPGLARASRRASHRGLRYRRFPPRDGAYGEHRCGLRFAELSPASGRSAGKLHEVEHGQCAARRHLQTAAFLQGPQINWREPQTRDERGDLSLRACMVA